MDHKDSQGISQEQLNEITAAYYAQQIEMAELRHGFTSRLQTKIVGRIIAASILRLFR